MFTPPQGKTPLRSEMCPGGVFSSFGCIGDVLSGSQDSVELKNICLRMTLSDRGPDSDRDLKELRLCLQLIVNSLLSAVRHQDNGSSTGATRRLMGISITLPDI